MFTVYFFLRNCRLIFFFTIKTLCHYHRYKELFVTMIIVQQKYFIIYSQHQHLNTNHTVLFPSDFFTKLIYCLLFEFYIVFTGLKL